jgi:PhzF family phenazine biosynthesis protein
MPLRPFRQVDVFGSAGYDGNPLAVVHEAEGLEPVEMQLFASWTGLSETTFLLPPNRPDADYRVRIFTPREELPFAGHPRSAPRMPGWSRAVSRGRWASSGRSAPRG